MATKEIKEYEWEAFNKSQGLAKQVFSAKSGEISSHFFPDPKPTCWYSSQIALVETGDTGKGIFKSSFSVSYDRAHIIWIRQLIPAVEVREGHDNVEICWTPNLGHNIIRNAILEVNNSKFELTSTALDIISQFYLTGSRNMYDRMIGNTEALTSWTKSLPESITKTIMPWFISRHPSFSLPLHIIRGNFPCSITWNMNHIVLSLLQVRIRQEDGSYKYIENNREKRKYVDIDEKTTFDNPEVWCKYRHLTSDERDYFKCIGKPFKLYVDNYIEFEDKNDSRIGSVSDVPIRADRIVKAVYWVAQNQTSAKRGRFSNYTTVSENSDKEGKNPCGTFSLMYGSVDKYKDLPRDMFDEIEPFLNAFSEPSDEGYNGYWNTIDMKSTDPDVGFNYKDLETSVQIRLQDPDQKCEDSFRVKVLVHVLEEFEVGYDGESNPVIKINN
jgi:hypothetical protein